MLSGASLVHGAYQVLFSIFGALTVILDGFDRSDSVEYSCPFLK